MPAGYEGDIKNQDWGGFLSAQAPGAGSSGFLSQEASIRAEADASLSVRIDNVSAGGGSVTSAEVAALVQIASAAATSADAHANTVSGRAVSISAELNSLLNSVESRLSTRIDTASTTGGSVTSQEVSVLVQTASAAATSADAHANTVSARAVSISAELASLVQIASAAATSADNHANTVSSFVAGVSARSTGDVSTKGLQSVINALSNRISIASATGGGGSVTSQEMSVLVQTASAAATSADAHANTASAAATSADGHANTVSARVVSVSAELASLVQIASAAATSADGHANTVSARVVSVSAELASLIQIASAAATSADGHANTVSARAVSISAELNSLLNSIESRLSSRIDTASGGGVGSISARSVGNVSTQGLQSVVNALSNRISAVVVGITDEVIAAYAAAGSSIFAYPVANPHPRITTSQSLTDGQLELIAVYLPLAKTVTGVKWYQHTAGSFTADNNNKVGLYSFSGGTLTLQASSNTDGNLWQPSSNTINNKAFASTYDAAVGLYFIGLLANWSSASTAPALGAATALANTALPGLDFANSTKFTGKVTSQTDLPSSQAMSGVTAQTVQIWAALY